MKLVYHKNKARNFRYSKQRKIYKALLRSAISNKLNDRKAKFRSAKYKYAMTSDTTSLIKLNRRDFIKEFYSHIKYNDHNKKIDIKGSFGLEVDIENYIDVAEQFIGSHPRSFFFDITNCTRMWPSGIMLLCSLARWVELTLHPAYKPNIGSSDSNDEHVNSYLTHCGFYDYVKRAKPKTSNCYDEQEVVKIRRESDMSGIETREDEIIGLLSKYSIYNKEDVEDFGDNVLIEVFNNITEHGRNIKGAGWWTISQYHKRTGIISICFADNGIGFKYSLLTGPQKTEILEKIGKDNDHDGDFIKLSLNENVSGAIAASTKNKGLFIKSYHRGSRRGNGLKRITATCKKLGIPIVIISQKGYIYINENGEIQTCNTRKNKIFAGTLYYLRIPAKKGLSYERN